MKKVLFGWLKRAGVAVAMIASIMGPINTGEAYVGSSSRST
ncbi:MAG: hypothetical protein ACI9FJ_002548 [Alteromonadaceae bacterium]|jgi:hypothetical protein